MLKYIQDFHILNFLLHLIFFACSFPFFSLHFRRFCFNVSLFRGPRLHLLKCKSGTRAYRIKLEILEERSSTSSGAVQIQPPQPRPWLSSSPASHVARGHFKEITTAITTTKATAPVNMQIKLPALSHSPSLPLSLTATSPPPPPLQHTWLLKIGNLWIACQLKSLSIIS